MPLDLLSDFQLPWCSCFPLWNRVAQCRSAEWATLVSRTGDVDNPNAHARDLSAAHQTGKVSADDDSRAVVMEVETC